MSDARNIQPLSILRIRSATTVENLSDPAITSVVIKEDANPEVVQRLDDKIKFAYVTSTYGEMLTLINVIPPHIAVILVGVDGAFVTVFRKERVEENANTSPPPKLELKRKRASAAPAFSIRDTLFGTAKDFKYIHNLSSANVIKMLLTNVASNRLRRANQTLSFNVGSPF